jgi:hypothetical protein
MGTTTNFSLPVPTHKIDHHHPVVMFLLFSSLFFSVHVDILIHLNIFSVGVIDFFFLLLPFSIFCRFIIFCFILVLERNNNTKLR